MDDDERDRTIARLQAELARLGERLAEAEAAATTAQALGKANRHLAMAVDLGEVVIWRHDLASNRIRYDDLGWKWIGLQPRPEGLLIDELRSLIHPDDLPLVLASVERALAADEPDDVEARYRRAEGGWRSLLTRRTVERDGAGKPVAFLGVALDVTERRLAEDALREASQRAAFITRYAGIGTWEAAFDGQQERWDEQMWALRGLEPRAEPPSRDGRLALVHPDDVHLVLDARPQAKASEASQAYEFRVRLPDGGWRWLASRSVIVRDERGAPLRRVGANWDVTESKDAERARQQAAVAERDTQAKSHFLSRMSHELRTPLNAVLGFTQLLQLEARQAGRTAALTQLGHIRTAGEHLLHLVDDVLDLSGVESGEIRLVTEPVDLVAFARATLPMVEALALRHGVRCAVAPAGPAPVLAAADPTRFRQVLLNLLSNAVKYNRRGGRVDVRVGRDDGGRATLAVEDTGRGLTEEQQASLFEPFNRFGADREGIEGTGIGLTIVKALVAGMGGTIVVESRPGTGTTFVVSLPTPAGDADAAPPAAAPAAAPPSSGRTPRNGRILYIEDNEVNVLLVEELVRRVGGLELVSAPTGAAGVARAAEAQPDIVLVDLQLPDFDGFEVLRRLRAGAATRDLRCIALSANAMADDIARGRAAGFDDYWTKPIEFGAFVANLVKLFPVQAVEGRFGAAAGSKRAQA